MLTFNEKLRKVIAAHEGLRYLPYLDTKGLWTVGIGHNLSDCGLSAKFQQSILGKEGLCNKEVIQELKNRKLTDAEVNAIFEDDLKDILGFLQKLDWYNALNDDRKIVIIDMCMMGVEKLLKFKWMIEAIKREDWKAAACNILQSKWAIDVKSRRANFAYEGMLNGLLPWRIL